MGRVDVVAKGKVNCMAPGARLKSFTQMASWSGSVAAPLLGSGERHAVLDPDWTKVRTPEEDAVAMVVVVIAEFS